jgi:hypothetical protein
MSENVTTENNLPDTTGNIFNIDECVIRINKKLASVITGKASDLASGERCGNIGVIPRCDAAIQLLPPVLTRKGVKKKQEFGDGLYTRSYMYM